MKVTHENKMLIDEGAKPLCVACGKFTVGTYNGLFPVCFDCYTGDGLVTWFKLQIFMEEGGLGGKILKSNESAGVPGTGVVDPA